MDFPEGLENTPFNQANHEEGLVSSNLNLIGFIVLIQIYISKVCTTIDIAVLDWYKLVHKDLIRT